VNESAKLKTKESQRLRRSESILEARQKLNQGFRSFFSERGFLEVETPVRVPAPAPEEHINCPPAGERQWLRASPELHMKRLLAALHRPLFQIGPCFRENERGRFHLPEFSMLEWYRPQADCRDILEDTVNLVRHCAEKVIGKQRCVFRGQQINLDLDWSFKSLDRAFAKWADLSLEQAVTDERFEEILISQVLPAMDNSGKPVVLHGFPLSLGSLARTAPGVSDRADRWELFIAGIEIANAYSELTDIEEQKRRFEQTINNRKSRGLEVYPLDRNYLETLETNFPESGGIALGIDRLLMVLTGCDKIDDAVPFVPESELL